MSNIARLLATPALVLVLGLSSILGTSAGASNAELSIMQGQTNPNAIIQPPTQLPSPSPTAMAAMAAGPPRVPHSSPLHPARSLDQALRQPHHLCHTTAS